MPGRLSATVASCSTTVLPATACLTTARPIAVLSTATSATAVPLASLSPPWGVA